MVCYLNVLLYNVGICIVDILTCEQSVRRMVNGWAGWFPD
jgi:hypothetical protein